MISRSFSTQKLFQHSSIIYSRQNSSFLLLSLLYKLTFSENCPIYFMTKYFNIFNVFLLNFYKIKFYNSYCLKNKAPFLRNMISTEFKILKLLEIRIPFFAFSGVHTNSELSKRCRNYSF